MLKTWITIALFSFASFGLLAQKTATYEDPAALFQSAVDLYDNNVFNSAIHKFQQYLDENPNALNTVDVHFYIAESKLRLEHDDALTLALDLLKEHPENRKANDLNYAIANAYLAKSKFKQAARHLKDVDILSIPKEEKDNFTFNLAYSLFKSKKYKEAAKEFQPLTVQENPYYLKSNYYYGYSLYQEKNYDGALQAFKRIENKGPQTMKLYVAQIYYLKGMYKEAIDEANSIALPNIKEKSQMVIGKSYYKLKQYDKAIIAFGKANISPATLSEMELYEVGYAYYKTKDYNNAFDYLSPIANNGTEIAQLASYNLGHCFLAQNKKQNALNAFFEAQRRDFSPEVREEALFQYAKISYDLDNSVNATSAFQSFLEDYPNSKHSNEAKGILASLFVNTNDYKTALSILEQIENWDNNTKKLYQKISFSRALELINGRDYEQARIALNNTIKHPINKEKTAAAHFWLGEIATREDKNGEALNHYNTFISLPESKNLDLFPSAYYNLGYLYFKKSNYNKAVVYFTKVSELKSSYNIEGNKLNDNYLRMGDCNYMLKRYNEALDAYTYTTSANRTESDYALFQQGMIYGLANKAAQKIQIMKRIPRDFPHSIYIPDAIFELASEQMQLENYKEAERNFQYLIVDFPKSTYKKRAFLSLGLIYYNSSKDEEALVEFKNVVNEFPGTDEAKDAASFVEKIYLSNGESEAYLSWLESLPNRSVSASFKDSVSFDAAKKRLSKGDCTVSIQDFENYIKNYPKGFFVLEAHNFALYCARQNKDQEKEIAHLKALSEGNTTEYTEQSLWDLADIYEAKNSCLKSVEYLTKVEKITRSIDKIKESYYRQIECYESLKDTANMEIAALKLYGQKVLTDEQEGKVLVILGEKYFRANDYTQSYHLFEKARKKFNNENGAQALYFMALINFNQDSLAQAKAKILEFGEDYSYYEYWFGKCFILLSDIYLKNDDHFQAKATLNSVIDNFKDVEIVTEAKFKLAQLEVEEKEEKAKNINEEEDTIQDGGE